MPGIPCCNNYSVNISSVDSGAIFNGIVNDTFIELDVPSPHQCSVYEVQVSAFNGLGEGEVLITKWSPGGECHTITFTANHKYYVVDLYVCFSTKLFY